MVAAWGRRNSCHACGWGGKSGDFCAQKLAAKSVTSADTRVRHRCARGRSADAGDLPRRRVGGHTPPTLLPGTNCSSLGPTWGWMAWRVVAGMFVGTRDWWDLTW